MAYSPGFCTKKAKLGLGTVTWRSKVSGVNFNHQILKGGYTQQDIPSSTQR